MEPLAMLGNSNEFPDHKENIAVSESIQTRSGSFQSRTLSKAWYTMPILVALATLYNSASPELREMLVWVDYQCFVA